MSAIYNTLKNIIRLLLYSSTYMYVLVEMLFHFVSDSMADYFIAHVKELDFSANLIFNIVL